MSFGQNLLSWFLNQAQPILMVVLVAIGVYILVKRETSKLLGFILLAVGAVLLVFNVTGVKDALLALGNSILGS